MWPTEVGKRNEFSWIDQTLVDVPKEPWAHVEHGKCPYKHLKEMWQAQHTLLGTGGGLTPTRQLNWGLKNRSQSSAGEGKRACSRWSRAGRDMEVRGAVSLEADVFSLAWSGRFREDFECHAKKTDLLLSAAVERWERCVSWWRKHSPLWDWVCNLIREPVRMNTPFMGAGID